MLGPETGDVVIPFGAAAAAPAFPIALAFQRPVECFTMEAHRNDSWVTGLSVSNLVRARARARVRVRVRVRVKERVRVRVRARVGPNPKTLTLDLALKP